MSPLDPTAEGATSEVAIYGDKTNVLFHPRPTTSYQPMFKKLEYRAMGLCVIISLAIIFLGRLFGGSLWGFIPLAACIASGVWLWTQHVIRSGKEMEWDSERLRGQAVCLNLAPGSVSLLTTHIIGDRKAYPRICGMGKHLPRHRLGYCKSRHIPTHR